MPVFSEQDTKAIREHLAASLQRPVQLALFISEPNCPYCDSTRELLEALSVLNDNLSLSVYDLQADAERAAALGVDKAPGIAVLGGAEGYDYGIRFYGIPSGYEFASLLEAIRMVGSNTVELQPATRQFLAELAAPMHLQVFVTPSCPYCPRAVVLAHRLAYASPQVIADAVEVTEFPELGDRYQVMGVPRTVIDEVVHVEGAVPEGMLLAKLIAARPEVVRQPGTQPVL
jgi:glutaredoxin-like protein